MGEGEREGEGPERGGSACERSCKKNFFEEKDFLTGKEKRSSGREEKSSKLTAYGRGSASPGDPKASSIKQKEKGRVGRREGLNFKGLRKQGEGGRWSEVT